MIPSGKRPSAGKHPPALELIKRALLEDQDWYRDLVEHSQDLLCIHDLQGRLLSINPAPARVLGYTVEELLQTPMRALIAPEFRSQFDAYLSQIARTGDARGLMAVITRSGERRVWEYHNTLRTEGVATPIVRGMARDVTEQVRAERALRQSEADLRRAQTVAHIGSWRYDCGNGSVTFSDETCRILHKPIGCPLDGKDVMDLIHPDDQDLVRRNWGGALGRGRYDLEHRILLESGLRWVHVQAEIELDEKGRPLAAVGTVQDITERKQTEQAITTMVERVHSDSSASFFSSMAQNLTECLGADYTLIGELVEGEEEAIRTIGVCSRGTITANFTYKLAGTPCADVVTKGLCSYASGVAGMFPGDQLLQKMKVEGYVGTPLLNSQGHPIGIMVALYTRPIEDAKFAESILLLFSARTAAEIERMHTEEALRLSEERLRVALKNAPIQLFHQDLNLRYTWAHNLREGWNEQDYLGKTEEDVFAAEAAAQMRALKQPVLETGQSNRGQLTIVLQDRACHCDLTAEPLRNAAGEVVGVSSACMDVTTLHQTTEQLQQAKEKLEEEKVYLEQEIDEELDFGEIIGAGTGLKAVMEQVAKVAPSDAIVLLLGETGVGKELVARAIHRWSPRRDQSFIKMNCAAIPAGLLESELFGYERGAFTGAARGKRGRVELADKGTLFLDEIGELPLTLQPKLLRVLQDREFEHLGGTRTRKVDFRLVAATNRDLVHSVKERLFRSDLFYRLNVFPIRVPPLRERRQDIPLLVDHFAAKFMRRMNKSITSIPKKTMEVLANWDWPGNVRELENFVERSVILTPGSVLQAPLMELGG
jgi:formate hydrogenlyase transcriptional activator